MFLLKEKRTEFLLRMCDRVRDFVEQLPHTEEGARLTAQVDALTKEFGGAWVDDVVPIDSLAGASGEFSNLYRLASCEICAEIAEELWRFLSRYQYELLVKHAEQESFAERGGFWLPATMS